MTTPPTVAPAGPAAFAPARAALAALGTFLLIGIPTDILPNPVSVSYTHLTLPTSDLV